MDDGVAAVGGKLDASHVMEAMPGCCDVISDEQVRLVDLFNSQSTAVV